MLAACLPRCLPQNSVSSPSSRPWCVCFSGLPCVPEMLVWCYPGGQRHRTLMPCRGGRIRKPRCRCTRSWGAPYRCRSLHSATPRAAADTFLRDEVDAPTGSSPPKSGPPLAIGRAKSSSVSLTFSHTFADMSTRGRAPERGSCGKRGRSRPRSRRLLFGTIQPFAWSAGNLPGMTSILRSE
jgi:hypothetical protein